jgi:hypothetical protein
MKIRSLLDLNDVIGRELAWRKKELSAISILIQKRRDHERIVLLRAAVPILYAHWEGFIKKASSCYLQYVSRRKLKYADLKSNFVALACKSALSESLNSNKLLLFNDVVYFITHNQQEVAQIPYENVIDTKSNLNSDVFINIIHQLGVSYDSFYNTKELIIDGSLLKKRNQMHMERELKYQKGSFLIYTN